MRTFEQVEVSAENCIKLFLVKTVDMLEVFREVTAADWIAAQSFMELKECLRGDIFEIYEKMVADNNPTSVSYSHTFGRPPLSQKQDFPVHDEQD